MMASRNAPRERRRAPWEPGALDFRRPQNGAVFSRCAIRQVTPGDVLVETRRITHQGGSK